jgi:hypothetical protein
VGGTPFVREEAKSQPGTICCKQKIFQFPKPESDTIQDAYDEIELLGFTVSVSPFDLLITPFRGEIMAKDMSEHTGKTTRMVGWMVAIKYVRTIKKEMMHFGCFLDYKGHFFDTVHFPQASKSFPFRGNGVYLLKGTICNEFGFPSLTVDKMARLSRQVDCFVDVFLEFTNPNTSYKPNPQTMKQSILLLLVALLLGTATTVGQQPVFTGDQSTLEYQEEQGIQATVQEKLLIQQAVASMKEIPQEGILLMPHSGTNAVMSFDPETGDLLDAFFFPADDDNLSTPIKLIWNHDGTGMLISDQTKRLVQEYDVDGVFQGTFAPIGGRKPGHHEQCARHTDPPQRQPVGFSSGRSKPALCY